MNERIKDFAKQSKEHASALFPDHTKFNYMENWHEAYHNKFAELIVKEAGKYLTSPEFIGRSDLDWSMILNEHFGVE